jgi:hypothetical protein
VVEEQNDGQERANEQGSHNGGQPEDRGQALVPPVGQCMIWAHGVSPDDRSGVRVRSHTAIRTPDQCFILVNVGDDDQEAWEEPAGALLHVHAPTRTA